MKQFSRFLALALALCLCLGLAPVLAEDAPITVTEIQKYGNMVLSVSGSDLRFTAEEKTAIALS